MTPPVSDKTQERMIRDVAAAMQLQAGYLKAGKANRYATALALLENAEKVLALLDHEKPDGTEFGGIDV